VPPTGEPVAEEIVADIVSTLGSIAAGAEYYHTIAPNAVKRFNGAYPHLTQHPAAVVIDLGSDSDTDLSEATRDIHTEVLRLQVDFWIEARTNVATELRRVEHDVKKALWADVQRGTNSTHGGKNAIMTLFERATPFFSPDAGSPLALLELGVMVHYRTDSDDPTKPR